MNPKLKPGSTVFTVLRHVSRSGMQRTIDVLVMVKGEPRSVLYLLTPEQREGLLRRFRRDRDRDGFKVGGCGMDMGFHLVYEISSFLYPKGFACIGEDCPANDHANGDLDRTPGHVVHRDGGYALRQRWI